MATSLTLINELKALEDREGRLTPERVLNAAEDEESPLHQHFTWDDGEAAHQHRLNQARTLIRNCRVHIELDNRTINAVAYIRDPEALTKEQGYRSITGLRLDADNAHEAAVAEVVRATHHLRRAREIGECLGLPIEEINDILEQLGGMARRYETPGPMTSQ